MIQLAQASNQADETQNLMNLSYTWQSKSQEIAAVRALLRLAMIHKTQELVETFIQQLTPWAYKHLRLLLVLWMISGLALFCSEDAEECRTWISFAPLGSLSMKTVLSSHSLSHFCS